MRYAPAKKIRHFDFETVYWLSFLERLSGCLEIQEEQKYSLAKQFDLQAAAARIEYAFGHLEINLTS